jgi:4-hydroxybenzoate polyprenyltransferase
MRLDHWVKNVFVLPGTVIAWSVTPNVSLSTLGVRLVLGLLSVCLISSSNYVLNEILDAPFDRMHATKSRRPVPAGLVNVRLAYLLWLLLLAAGLLVAIPVSGLLVWSMVSLWIMGCLYNIRPLRTKDLPYVDVLSESVNNPIRLVAGWAFVPTASVPPLSLLVSYWMIGSYFMALKRFSEYRDMKDPGVAAAYRRSFRFYTADRLLISVMFYGCTAMLLLGAFLMRYRLELIVAYPFVALVMATYFAVALKDDSAAQRPEKLYREPFLMAAVVVCAAVMVFTLFKDMPLLHQFFAPMLPIGGPASP